MKRLIRQLGSRRGSMMTEAAISLPMIILAAMLMLRMFVFYLEILTTGISEHKAALLQQDSYRGAAIRTYTKDENVSIRRGGLLRADAVKRIGIRTYLINEDLLVRSGELSDQ